VGGIGRCLVLTDDEPKGKITIGNVCDAFVSTDLVDAGADIPKFHWNAVRSHEPFKKFG
jgi:hypothetical protein